MTLTGFTTEHPYLSSAVFLLIFVLALITFAIIDVLFRIGIVEQVALVDSILAIIGLFLVNHLGWWEKAGYTTGIRRVYVPLLILPCAIALLSLGQGIRVTDPVMILTFAILTFVVGLAEETYFRGLIFTTLLPTGTIRAVVMSSFFFAALHLLNISGGIWDPAYAVADMISVFGLGITYAAIRLRTGSIWPLVGIHALFDFTSLITFGGIEVIAQSPQVLFTTVIIGIVFEVYGLFLLREKKDRVI
jgi:uncharacterized protein